jgi:hypothetical protein
MFTWSSMRAGGMIRAPPREPKVVDQVERLPGVQRHGRCDNFSSHLSTRKHSRVGAWASASNAEIAGRRANRKQTRG